MEKRPQSSETGLYLSAREAATELGVSLASLYAYVSRGLIRSEGIPGERTKRYRADDVRALREQRAPPRCAEKNDGQVNHLGRNQPVFDSQISLIANGELYYRGVNATDIANHATLETVAGLLWQTSDYTPFSKANLPTVSDSVGLVIGSTRESHPVARCAAVLALAGDDDSGAFNRTDRGLAFAAARITRLMASLVGGVEISNIPIHEQVGRAWSLDAAGTDLVRMALVLLADHELNASTFTLRCAISTGANLYEGIVAALAALKGRLHGGATTRAACQLEQLLDGDVRCRIREQAETGERFVGFGHRIYRDWDPRSRALLDAIGRKLNDRVLTHDVPEYVYKAVGVYPNIDYAMAVLGRLLNLPPLAGIGLFAVGRSIGWAAHAREQMRERSLIRPRARYTGPAPNN